MSWDTGAGDLNSEIVKVIDYVPNAAHYWGPLRVWPQKGMIIVLVPLDEPPGLLARINAAVRCTAMTLVQYHVDCERRDRRSVSITMFR